MVIHFENNFYLFKNASFPVNATSTLTIFYIQYLFTVHFLWNLENIFILPWTMKTDFIFPSFSGGTNACVLMVYWGFSISAWQPQGQKCQRLRRPREHRAPHQDTRGKLSPLPRRRLYLQTPTSEVSGGSPVVQEPESPEAESEVHLGKPASWSWSRPRGPASGLRAWWRCCFSKVNLPLCLFVLVEQRSSTPSPMSFSPVTCFSHRTACQIN